MRQAFDIGREAVKNEPHILRAGAESDKFLLLPEDGDHAIALCKALAVGPNPNPDPNPQPNPNPTLTPTRTPTLTPSLPSAQPEP